MVHSNIHIAIPHRCIPRPHPPRLSHARHPVVVGTEVHKKVKKYSKVQRTSLSESSKLTIR